MPPKRRRKFQGLYYHSSPPKVLPMNGQITNSNGRRRRDPDDLSVKLSTIRIWMHEKDIGKLTRVLWAGQGNRLRQQASTNPKVKRFLTAVPYVMNSIKDVHQAVIDNSLETLQSNLEPPVPPALVTCRDANGLNLIHKAAGLGHATILEYLITTWPDGVHETDITGKTPLHWAASAKNNMRCYTLLTQAGCDEEAVDYKMKTPSFYRHKPNEIERAFLTYVPEAPRVSPDIATDWEALSDDGGDGKKMDIKIPEMNGYGRHSNAESNENTSEADMTEAGQDDENMSKDDDAAENDQELNEANNKEELEETVNEENENQVESTEEEQNQEEIIEGTTENEEQTIENQEEQEKTEEETEPQEEESKESMEQNDEHQNEKQQHLQMENQNEIIENLSKDSHQDDAEKKSNSNEITEEGQDDAVENDKDNESPEITNTSKQLEESNDHQNTEVDKDDAAEESEEAHETTDLDKHEETTESNEDINQEKENIEEKDNEKRNESVDENILKEKSDKEKEELQESFTEEKQHIDEIHEADESHENIEKENESKQETTESETEENPINTIENTEETKTIEETNNETENNSEEIQDEKQEVEGDYKTVGEALGNIKEEVKDNVKYLANQIKNVFKDNKSETTENSIENLKNEDENETETETNISEPEESKETEEENKTEEDNDCENKEEENETETIHEAKTDQDSDNQEIPKTPIQNTEQSQTTSAHDKPSSAKEISQTETEKTEEDENNNSKSKENSSQDDITDAELEEINKALEEYQKAEHEEEEETEEQVTNIGNKIEEIADTLKENVHEIADKIKNVFTGANDTEPPENETNDVVVHPINTKNLNGLHTINKSMESSDETGDEDEDPQGYTEKFEENSKESEIQNEEKTEISNETTEEEVKKPEDETQNDTKEPPADGNKNDDQEHDADGSPTSSLAIEGFVQGDAEDNTVQSQTAAIDHDDKESRIQSIIASGDMEQLAQIVLNGDGQKLLDVEATEPEIQAFLRNVPNYMNKIRRVHEAARAGSLLNLQQALDRRKFAVAKDEISPNGATPLHVAILFGHSDIVRYLSARFPETLTAIDKDGRTPLHYAAVISDNGHFYNVLLQLGANPKLVDRLGHTPEDYLSKEELKNTLNYGELLKSYGAEELEQQILSDQGKIENHYSHENPIFKTEQGKYLADNLADPLIKALTHVAQKRPNDPLQYLTNYLQNYVATRNTNGRTITQAAIHSGSSDTNSTILAHSKSSTPPAHRKQMSRMNGHISNDSFDNIDEENAIKHIEEFTEANDDGNDSDAEMSKKFEERDEHGQSMLHFACARSHRKGGLIHLIEEAKADITYRDELYRTARDVALQANQLGNAKEIDRYVLSLAIVGDIKPFDHLAISGYDHIIDVVGDDEMPIIDVVESRGNTELAEYLRSIRPLEELREELHQMIRENKMERIEEIANGPSGRWLIKAKNYYGRTALHIAILKEAVEVIEMFVNLAPEALKIGDNLERTPLHYAMGSNVIENISRVLIQNGAKRTIKDLKGRQPSYYFMNKADILRLQEEEDENR